MGYRERFIEKIIDLSQSKNWSEAKKEWNLLTIYEDESDRNCLCGHEIYNVCVIKNKITGNKAEVGNVCVTKFMEGTELSQSVDWGFPIWKRLSKNPLATVPEIYSFYVNAIISEWEYNFYISLGRKRKLSPKQEEIKLRINHKILDGITKVKNNKPQNPLTPEEQWVLIGKLFSNELN